MPSPQRRPVPADTTPGHRRRIAFYSHDTQGLGHIRRNITLAAALVDDRDDTDVVLLTGNPEATALPLPPHTDLVTLPTIGKDAGGAYAGRALGSPLRRITAMRAGIVDATVTAFDPDLLVVDKVAAGVNDELLPALERCRARGRTRMVLGLREILDEDEAVRRDWRRQRTTEVVRAFYDEVWIYGDAAVYDLTAEHAVVREISDRVRFTGYLAAERATRCRPRWRVADRARPPAAPYVLGMVGGGQDGLRLAAAFAGAALPTGHRGVLVTGPYLPHRHLEALGGMTSGRDDLTVLSFIPDADSFINGAAAVVSMAGYNTVCELLAAGVPALLAPRTAPRREQWIRADRLTARGVVDMVEPAALTSATVTGWLATAVTRPAAVPAVDVHGLRRIPCLVTDLLEGARRAA